MARGASGTLLVGGLGQALVFGVQLLLVRIMGAEHYGVYAYVLTWINVLFLLSRMGLDVMLIRYVAAYSADKEWGLMRGLIQMSSLWGLLASLITAGITAYVVWLFRQQLGDELVYAFWAGSALLPAFLLAAFCQSGLNGLKRVVLAQLPNRLLRQTLLALLVVTAAWLLHVEVTGAVALLLTTVAVLGGFAVSLFWFWRHLPTIVWQSIPVYRNREWILTALPLMLSAGAFMLTQKTDTLMIGAMLGTKEAGIYVVASRIAEFTMFGGAATAIAAPHMSEFYIHKKLPELQRVVSLATWGAVAFSIPFAVVIYLYGAWLLGLFGTEFVHGYWALMLLVFGQVGNAMTGPTGVLMNMTGHQNQLLSILVVALLLNALLNYILILNIGIAGAALATALVKIGYNVVAVVYVYRRFDVNCFAINFRS